MTPSLPLSLLTEIIGNAPPVVKLVAARCLRKRLHTNECRRCLDVCDRGALTLDKRQVQLDTAQCSGCMRCQAVCPGEALTSPYTPEIPARHSVHRNHVVFSCIRYKQASPDHVVVPCLGLFSPLSLMVLAMSGCRTVLFNIAPCSVCVNKGATASFAAALDQVAPLSMQLSGAALIATADPSDLVTDSNADRRAFLLNLGHSLSAFAGKKNPPESIKPASPPHTNRRIPRNTGLVMGMLQSVTGETREKLRSLCTYQLTVSSACIPCPRCAGICPTGALRLERSDTGKQLLFNASQCSGCGLCAAFCTANALALTAPFLCAT